MTLLVWAGARLTRTSAFPRPLVMWTGTVITARLFGAGHLPTTAAFLPLTLLVIGRALLLNGMAGSSSVAVLKGWPTGRNARPFQRRRRPARRGTVADPNDLAPPRTAVLAPPARGQVGNADLTSTQSVWVDPGINLFRPRCPGNQRCLAQFVNFCGVSDLLKIA